MGQVQAKIQIAAPPERVWAAISSPETYERWLTIHTKWKGEVPERFSRGATVAEVVTMLGMANTITWTVEEFEEPARVKISGTGVAGVKSTFSLNVAADGNGGSQASIEAAFEGQMITGALGKAVEQDAQANLDQSLTKLAQLVGS